MNSKQTKKPQFFQLHANIDAKTLALLNRLTANRVASRSVIVRDAIRLLAEKEGIK